MSESKNHGRVGSIKTSASPNTASIYFGKCASGDSMVDVHVYNRSNGSAVDFLEFKVEDMVDAFNNIPGVTATIDAPEPHREPTNYEVVRDLPVGSVFRWSTTTADFRYVKISDEEIIHITGDSVCDGYTLDNFDHGDGNYNIVVIYKPEV